MTTKRKTTKKTGWTHVGAAELARKIAAAVRPSEVFDLGGASPAELKRSLKLEYTSMLVLVHPDHNPGVAEAATVAAKLNRLRDEAAAEIAAGTWGRRGGVVVDFDLGGKPAKLVRVVPFRRGDVCELYEAVLEPGSESVVLKLADRSCSDLVAAEATVLRDLWKRASAGKDVVFTKYLPELLAQVKLDGRSGNVLRKIEGCYTLDEVLDAFPEGLDERHVSWIWRRLLEVVAWAHGQGRLHGSILPSNVLVRPSDHGAVLLDWTATVSVGSPVRVMVGGSRLESYYPPETRSKGVAGPAHDVYMLGKIAQSLLFGRDHKRSKAVSPLFLGPIRACTIADPTKRWQSVVELYQQFDKNLRRLFGPPKFVEFKMP